MTRELLNISTKQIYSFLTAAKYGSLSTAAEILFTSQSSVSRSISSLEQQCGFLLFNRKTVGVELTSMGKALYTDWLEHLESMERSLAFLKETPLNNHVKLVLADINNIPVERYLLPLMNGFNRENPNIDLQVHRINMLDIIQGVRAKSFDAAFTSSPGVEIFKEAGYDLLKATEIEANLIVGKNNPAISNGKFDAEKLHGQPLVIMNRPRIEDFDMNLFKLICGFADNNNIEINEVVAVESPQAMHLKLVTENCWTILSKLNYNGLAYIPLKDKLEYFLGINQTQTSLEIKHFARFANQLFANK